MPDERFMKWWESNGKSLSKEEFMDYSVMASAAFMSGLELGRKCTCGKLASVHLCEEHFKEAVQ